MKTSVEFKVGKHKIGWISSDFIERVGDEEFESSTTLLHLVLSRSMKDDEIEKTVTKGQFATIGDVMCLLESADDTFKDGYANIFYLPSFVVNVRWDDGAWSVAAWNRGDAVWRPGSRVFSPATDPSTLEPGPSDSLTLEDRVRALEEWKERVQK